MPSQQTGWIMDSRNMRQTRGSLRSATYVTETVFDYIVWYAKKRSENGHRVVKVRDLFDARLTPDEETKFNTIITPDDAKLTNVSKHTDSQIEALIQRGGKWARVNYPIVSQHPSDTRSKDFAFRGREKTCGENKQWRFDPDLQMRRLEKANRLFDGGGASLGGVVFWEDWSYVARANIWEDRGRDRPGRWS